ncbi:MAG: hypothetical protein WBI63_04945 [Coriobacteriia bacterium]
MGRSHIIALALVMLAFLGLAGCVGSSGRAGDTVIATNGTPVMIEFYTDW